MAAARTARPRQGRALRCGRLAQASGRGAAGPSSVGLLAARARKGPANGGPPLRSLARPFAPLGLSGSLADAQAPLYNGNIAHSTTALPPQGGWPAAPGSLQPPVLAMAYRYDQLNRLRQATGITGIGAGNTWHEVNDPVADRYRSAYTYDANGNIRTADRHNDGGQPYDQLHYFYQHQPNAPDKRLRNRLYQLQDLADQPNALVNEPGGAQDIACTGPLAFDNDPATVNTANNYGYDALGNLVRDTREGIASIDWTAAGKVRQVVKADGTVLNFTYGAGGQRIMKEVIPAQGDAIREHYVRDAKGNVMAIYRAAPGSLALTERPLYGSARLGALRKSEELYAAPAATGPDPVQQLELRYELTDHLGNVCAVLTGRLLPGNGMGSQWQPEVAGAQGYEPFGSLLPGRNYSSDSYRYAFNGMEKDDEIYGAGNSYTAEYWQYDSRLGRRWNVDPMAHRAPNWSPYRAFYNNPIYWTDPTGLLEWHPETDADGNTNLVADPGDDFVTLMDYMNTIGLELSGSDITEFAHQIASLAQSMNYDIAGGSVSSTNNKFDNLVGTYLATRFSDDPSWGFYCPPGSMCCSPTLANRSAEAVKYVYGENSEQYQKLDRTNKWEGYIGYHLFQNNYANTSTGNANANNSKYGSNGIAGYGVTTDMRGHSVAGALEYSGTGYYIPNSEIWSGLQPGAALGLGYHTAIFIRYTYDTGGAVNGMIIWDDGNYERTISRGSGSPQPRVGGNWR